MILALGLEGVARFLEGVEGFDFACFDGVDFVEVLFFDCFEEEEEEEEEEVDVFEEEEEVDVFEEEEKVDIFE